MHYAAYVRRNLSHSISRDQEHSTPHTSLSYQRIRSALAAAPNNTSADRAIFANSYAGSGSNNGNSGRGYTRTTSGARRRSTTGEVGRSNSGAEGHHAMINTSTQDIRRRSRTMLGFQQRGGIASFQVFHNAGRRGSQFIPPHPSERRLPNVEMGERPFGRGGNTQDHSPVSELFTGREAYSHEVIEHSDSGDEVDPTLLGPRGEVWADDATISDLRIRRRTRILRSRAQKQRVLFNWLPDTVVQADDTREMRRSGGGAVSGDNSRRSRIFRRDSGNALVEKEGAAQTCSICLVDFMEGDTAKRVPCGHLFHTSCCEPWFAVQTTCPVCRFDAGTAMSTSNSMQYHSDSSDFEI